jgi:DNA-binding beta-propeller fold protein YncE
MPKAIFVFLIASASGFAQQTSVPTALPSRPFVIRNIWFIGGQGNWNELKLDTQSSRLYITHEKNVQVVDVDDGSVAGQIGGFQDARDIVLDPAGTYGYVSDGGRARVTVFDRGSLERLADVPTEPSPSSLVLEPETGMLFAVGAAPAGTGTAPHSGRRRPQPAPPPAAASSITIIDPQTRSAIGAILLSEKLGAAQADGAGGIYVVSPGDNQLLRFDAQSAVNELQQQEPAAAKESKASEAPGAGNPALPTIDWTNPHSDAAVQGQLRAFPLRGQCSGLAGIALDGNDQRIFASCGNMQLIVLNAATGDLVTTLAVGPGAQGVGWDPQHGYIYVANGGGDGNVTVIHRNVTDTYNVVQTLPTRRNARTIAVDAGNGLLYLVTDYLGVQRGAPGGFGVAKTVPVAGSFQVLQIGQ